jgi:hypothetical protein|uniref:Glycosyltransferase n=1 Tax=viral metagenome TaxID=1070528 RepID=A0A6C0IKR6_9ZZZZ
MKIIPCSNNLQDIKNVISSLITENENCAFFSYIDGEYGIRLHLYYSLGKMFYNEMKTMDIPVVALVFKGQTWSVSECSDIVIEVQSSYGFSHNTELTEKEYNDNKSNPSWVPTGVYTGSDGWRQEYFKGFHDAQYEKMIDDFNFSNLFYTTHCCGSKYTNPHMETPVNGTGCLYKINNQNVILNNIVNNYVEKYFTINTLKQTNNSKDYLLWIRNTNKWPTRNTPQSIIDNICKFCIATKRKCYVIQDLQETIVPDNEYIINYLRSDNSNGLYMKGSIHIDNIIELSKKCGVYIGADSGASEIMATNINIPMKTLGASSIYRNVILPQRNITFDNTDFDNLKELLLIK